MEIYPQIASTNNPSVAISNHGNSLHVINDRVEYITRSNNGYIADSFYRINYSNHQAAVLP